ncbi:hypothetical protein [Pseudescherichia sp.]|uniref:hypothetical protein n=1 Tax=Pseudescherichia sp. TaxID=2055881 RepID=UPI00289B31A0|nr:hypothetical protein [Pseudescherichia sp.]
MIEALRDYPDAAVLIQRLSGELALSRVMEQALVICIPLITLCSAWDVKVVMTLTFVQFALLFLTSCWELARWLDS